MKPVVLFSKDISPEGIEKIYEALSVSLPKKIALKLHSGEEGNQNYLGPEYYKSIVKKLNATVVEANTAYPGERDTNEKHLALLKRHGWSTSFNVDLLDEYGEVAWPVNGGKRLKEDFVGKDLENYSSLLVVSHFKGHPMGGYGGALKQLSIGCASSHGKKEIHTVNGETSIWQPIQDHFLEAMADAAKAVYDHFYPHVAFINVMKNMSVDCDCCSVAEDPCLKDIGVLASIDPVAVDQACIDLVMKSNDPGKAHFMERVNSRHGIHTIEAAAELGIGSREYTLKEIK
ncbi:MAG: DUF362 domain-containing protein [Bacilli bacterium]|jgi:uncharacterized Fe-S center protein|nr:DUF362 domain-containing protein [Bacilli bacterium]MCH4277660.1 DUF362 domain-containing protein [Bacilli bacterium]